MILQTFQGSEELTESLKSAFYNNPCFENASLPELSELDIDEALEQKLSFLRCNSAISFARECLRLDPN
jgi:hypothetical protein